MDNRLKNSSLIISYMSLRRAIGFLGIILPFLLLLGGLFLFSTDAQFSMSHYYYTGMRDVFVGTIWVIGFLLYSYKGYDWLDDLAGNLGCLFAIGLTLFPTLPAPLPVDFPYPHWVGIMHFVFAILFFGVLIYFSLFLFTKLGGKELTPARQSRIRIYRICGYTMIVCIFSIVLIAILPAKISARILPLNPIFWLEAIAVMAFGISWLTKGKAILTTQY